MKKLVSLIIGVVALFGLLTPVPARADAGWEIPTFDSQILVQPSGEVVFQEVITVDFHTLEKHGIFRDLPYIYQSKDGKTVYTDVEVIFVQRDGKTEPHTIERNGANMRIRIGDPDKTISQQHTYVLTYLVAGVLQSFDTYDELYWNVTGSDWEAPILRTTASITLPKPAIEQVACYRGAVGSSDKCIAQKTNDLTATFSADRLESGEGMTIATGFTSGIVPIVTVAAPPTLFEQILWAPLMTGFLLVVVIGLWLVYRRWLKFGRDEWYGHHATPDGEARLMAPGERESIAPEFAPPPQLRPAMMGTLLDERADTLDVSATIVDLAVRGFLTITEEKKKGLFGGKDYVLAKKKKATTDLLTYEKKLLDALFAGGDEVQLSSLENKFYTDLAAVKTALYEEVVKAKFFTKNPESVRLGYYGVGIGVFILGGIAVALLLGLHAWDGIILAMLLGVAFGVAVTGIVLISTAHTMPSRTALGRHLYRQSQGYKLFVSNVEKYRTPFLEKANMFEQVLPYAMVFGVTSQLAKAMKTLDINPAQPGWYYGVHPFSPAVFAKDVETFSSSLSSSMASSPSSSGSGGGGSSGGGFGGGGGGSW